MLDEAQPGQIFLGDFSTQLPTSSREEAYLVDVDTMQFVERVNRKLNDFNDMEVAGEKTDKIYCYVTGETGASGGETAKRYLIKDKHGMSRVAYNLRINIYRQSQSPIILGMQGRRLPKGQSVRKPEIIAGNRRLRNMPA
jgi:hypothetical protein